MSNQDFSIIKKKCKECSKIFYCDTSDPNSLEHHLCKPCIDKRTKQPLKSVSGRGSVRSTGISMAVHFDEFRHGWNSNYEWRTTGIWADGIQQQTTPEEPTGMNLDEMRLMLERLNLINTGNPSGETDGVGVDSTTESD